MNWVRAAFAGLVTVAFGAFAAYLVLNADTTNQTEWQRWVYIFGSVEAIAFTAVGWVFGKEVNRQRAESAEGAAKAATKEVKETHQKASKLAGMVIAGSGGAQGLQAMGTANPGLGEAVNYAKANFP
jgi:cytochrome bd-type quinol oxidase subunit 1